MRRARVVILGVFAADLTFRASRMPKLGETLLADGFLLGCGGKGSNQAIAAAKAGADARLVSRIGDDAFGALARGEWAAANVDMRFVTTTPDAPTGAAFIFVETVGGQNAILVQSGAAAGLSPADIIAARAAIEDADVFVTQLEQPLAAARAGLTVARGAKATTILNPAPAADLDDGLLALCDYVTPNESEAEALTGVPVDTLEAAQRAGDALLRRGAGCAIVTLGARGALLHAAGRSELVPAFDAGMAVDTTGAGDAFTGAFATALGEGRDALEAARFGCCAAGISVTRPGAGRSMPTRDEIDRAVAGG